MVDDKSDLLSIKIRHVKAMMSLDDDEESNEFEL
jgi:hypothetical protein